MIEDRSKRKLLVRAAEASRNNFSGRKSVLRLHGTMPAIGQKRTVDVNAQIGDNRPVLYINETGAWWLRVHPKPNDSRFSVELRSWE